ncbi:hypothetical protein sS8_4579 [Methylocaldum marinum]|uniref:Uncharacterized protein n=1 Tax=Methylocaldum marinum TaxID=1432792 RepID=A0A250L278_9GAMM|nr:hypothetical protein sS8_4579 [Methylocaldum marinum]
MAAQEILHEKKPTCPCQLVLAAIPTVYADAQAPEQQEHHDSEQRRGYQNLDERKAGVVAKRTQARLVTLSTHPLTET